MAKEVFLDEEQIRQGVINYPLVFQREGLGLDERTVSALRGKKVLDLGSGHEPRLVNYLRQKGVYAEGIDNFVSSSANIINQQIYPEPIPKTDKSYDLVLAHCLDVFDFGLTKYSLIRGRIEEMAGIFSVNLEDPKKVAKFIFDEAMRVLKRDGRLITRPAIDVETSENYEICRKDIERTAFREEGGAMYTPLVSMFELSEDFFRFMEQRSIIRKK